MKKYDKEVVQAELNSEKAVLKKLKQNYQEALDEINEKLEILLARDDADLAHVIYQVQYQKALKAQVQGILEKLHANEFETVSEYLTQSYDEGFIGTLYAMQAQGVPLAFPINQELVVAAVQHETMLTSNLYNELGLSIKTLQKEIAAEISRGVTNALGYSAIAMNIANRSKIPMNKAMTIARTESHRIRETAAYHVQVKAVEAGADVVKIWDASLDGKTRPHHRQLDGQIRELEEPFEVAGMKAMRPGGFGVAKEDINCRCRSRCEAKWALGSNETKMLGDVSKMDAKTKEEIAKKLGIPVDDLEQYSNQIVQIKASGYEDFKKKYKQASERVREGAQKMNDDIVQRLKDKGVLVDIEEAGKYTEEAKQSLRHLESLLDEYNSTTVSYTVTSKNISGDITEGGTAYMLNGRTAITIKPSTFRKNKATDSNHLGDNQPYGTVYHEFAHSLSQSREKIDKEFWKEVRKVKREYDGMRGEANWFDVKISDYAAKDIDEFMAEAFAQAKLSDNPSIYSQKVLDVVDKYFKKTTLENIGKSSTIELEDIVIHKGVGAKPKNYDILVPDTGEVFHFAEGTRIQNSEVFAGKGTKHPLHEGVAEGLSEQYGGTPDKWQHCKGHGVVDFDGEERNAEVHWFQEESVGKVKFKVKRWEDED